VRQNGRKKFRQKNLPIPSQSVKMRFFKWAKGTFFIKSKRIFVSKFNFFLLKMHAGCDLVAGVNFFIN